MRGPSGPELSATVLRVDREPDVALLNLPGEAHPALTAWL